MSAGNPKVTEGHAKECHTQVTWLSFDWWEEFKQKVCVSKDPGALSHYPVSLALIRMQPPLTYSWIIKYSQWSKPHEACLLELNFIILRSSSAKLSYGACTKRCRYNMENPPNRLVSRLCHNQERHSFNIVNPFHVWLSRVPMVLSLLFPILFTLCVGKRTTLHISPQEPSVLRQCSLFSASWNSNFLCYWVLTLVQQALYSLLLFSSPSILFFIYISHTSPLEHWH